MVSTLDDFKMNDQMTPFKIWKCVGFKEWNGRKELEENTMSV